MIGPVIADALAARDRQAGDRWSAAWRLHARLQELGAVPRLVAHDQLPFWFERFDLVHSFRLDMPGAQRAALYWTLPGSDPRLRLLVNTLRRGSPYASFRDVLAHPEWGARYCGAAEALQRLEAEAARQDAMAAAAPGAPAASERRRRLLILDTFGGSSR